MVVYLKNKSEVNNVCKRVIGFDPVKCECKTITMCNLQFGRKTLFELLKLMPGVSYDVINLKLTQLEEINLIGKRISYDYPGKTYYFLTTKGWQCVRSLREYVDLDSMVG